MNEKVDKERLLKFAAKSDLSDDQFRELLSIVSDSGKNGIDLGKESGTSDVEAQKVADWINEGTQKIVEQRASGK